MAPSSSNIPESSQDPKAGLVEALRLLEKDPESHPEAKQRLQGWLEQVEESHQEPHLTLDELKDLADHPGERPLPEHLRRCRMCMDLFQVFSAESPAASDTPSKSSRPSTAPETAPAQPKQPFKPARMLKVAGFLIVLFFAIQFLYRPPTLIVESGQLLRKGSEIQGSRVPAGAPLETLRETQLTLLDGSRLILEPGSVFRIGTKLDRTRHLTLQSGSIQVTMTDASSNLACFSGPLRISPGTASYVIQTDGNSVTLTVLEGAVETESSEGSVMVTSGKTRSWDL